MTYYTVRPSASNILGSSEAFALTSGQQLSAATDMMSAYGDCTNSTGYLWFAPTSTSNVERLTITKCKAIGDKKVFNAPASNGSRRAYVKQYNSNKVLWNQSASGSTTNELYVGSINESTSTISWKGTGLKACRYGSTAFMLGGKEIIAYSKSTTSIEIYNNTDLTPIGTITPFTTASTNSYVSHAMDVKVSGNVASLYIFVPGVGTAKYQLSIPNPTVSDVTAETFEARPYVATVSWKAPDTKASKYAVSYSSDGGSTWTSTFETTALSYTFTNLPVGTYTFKVAPYFSETSEWGDEVVSNNIEITDPVFYTFNVTKRWDAYGVFTGIKDIAVSKDRIYVASSNYGALSYIGPDVEGNRASNGSWPNFDTGYGTGNVGFALDNDDKGNIVVKTGNGGSSSATKFTVYAAGSTAKTNSFELALTGDYLPGGPTFYLAAEGGHNPPPRYRSCGRAHISMNGRFQKALHCKADICRCSWFLKKICQHAKMHRHEHGY